MMHKSWSSIKEVPYYFARSSVKFRNRTRQKLFSKVIRQISRSHGQQIANFDPNWAFLDRTHVWIHWWLWNDTQSLKWHRGGVLLFFKVDPSNVKFTRDKQLSFSLRIKRFRSRPSNCKIWDKTNPISTRIRVSRTLTLALIDGWLRSDAQSLK